LINYLFSFNGESNITHNLLELIRKAFTYHPRYLVDIIVN